MKHYSEELKAALVEKRLPPQHVPVGQLARETGIPKDTARTLGARRLAKPAG
jgi:transposase-like protein